MASGVTIGLFSSLSALGGCYPDAVQPPRLLKVSLMSLSSQIPCLRKGKSFIFFFLAAFKICRVSFGFPKFSTVRRGCALLLSLSCWELVLLGCVT